MHAGFGFAIHARVPLTSRVPDLRPASSPAVSSMISTLYLWRSAIAHTCETACVPIAALGPAGAGREPRYKCHWHRLRRTNSASIWRRSAPPSGLSTGRGLPSRTPRLVPPRRARSAVIAPKFTFETIERAKPFLELGYALRMIFCAVRHRSKGWDLQPWRSVRRAASGSFDVKDAFLSNPIDCWMDWTSASASARI